MSLSVQDLKKIFVHHAGLLKTADFEQATDTARASHQSLESVLLEQAFISQHQYLGLLGEYFNVPEAALKVHTIDPVALQGIPEKLAHKHLAVAFAEEGDALLVAFADPLDKEVIDELTRVTRRKIVPHVATEAALRRALALYGGDIKVELQKLTSHLDSQMGGVGPKGGGVLGVTHLIEAILKTGLLLEATDIHLEPYSTGLKVRFRIDGLLRTHAVIPIKLLASVMHRLKILASLPLSQSKLPASGQFTQRISGEEVAIKITTVPSVWGEKATLKLLPKNTRLLDLTNLGLLPTDIKIIQRYLAQPAGLLLVSGPSGAGKTSTLYALLQAIANRHEDVASISTLEDPVEFTIPHVTQVQVESNEGLTYGMGLEALLAQNTDVLMVGEVRDEATARGVCRSAMIGQLCLTSLHADSATETVTRLVHAGAEPYVLSATLKLVINQRLARVLCTFCRESYTPSTETLKAVHTAHDLDQAFSILEKNKVVSEPVKPETLKFYRSKGCERCDFTGYSGRTGVFELLEIQESVKAAINKGEGGTAALQAATAKTGAKPLFADGLAKVTKGVIGLEELLRITL